MQNESQEAQRVNSRPELDSESSDRLLDVVVVTYFSWNQASTELIGMIELAKSRPLAQWIFVDNSPDGSDAIRLRSAAEETENVSVVERRDNPGFAAGSNYGVSFGTADWIFCLNPDIAITAKDLDRITASISKPAQADCMAVSQVTRGFAHAGVGMTRYQWFTDRAAGSRMKLLGPSGGAGLYRRTTFLEAGGFYEPLFAWGEDADLALRLARVGSKCLELDLRLNHQGQHSVSSSNKARSLKARLLTRNRIVVAARNLPRWRALAFVLTHACVIILLTPRNLNRRTFKATWHGYYQGIRTMAQFASPTTGRRE